MAKKPVSGGKRKKRGQVDRDRKTFETKEVVAAAPMALAPLRTRISSKETASDAENPDKAQMTPSSDGVQRRAVLKSGCVAARLQVFGCCDVAEGAFSVVCKMTAIETRGLADRLLYTNPLAWLID